MLSSLAELEPAAVVYEVMTRRLEGLESKIQDLEKRLEISPTHDDVKAVAEALKAELLDHVDNRSVLCTVSYTGQVGHAPAISRDKISLNAFSIPNQPVSRS